MQFTVKVFPSTRVSNTFLRLAQSENGRRTEVFLTTGGPDLAADVIHPPVRSNGDRESQVIFRNVGFGNDFLKFPRRFAIRFNGANERQGDGTIILDPFLVRGYWIGDSGESNPHQVADGKAAPTFSCANRRCDGRRVSAGGRFAARDRGKIDVIVRCLTSGGQPAG